MRTSTVIVSLILMLPLLAQANIDIINHTGLYGTGKVKNGACSATLGDRGIIKPHGNLTLNAAEIIYLCGFKTCEAFLFVTNNCTGDKIATVTMDAYSGVKNVVNHKPGEYLITGGGSSLSIESYKLHFKNWLKWLF